MCGDGAVRMAGEVGAVAGIIAVCGSCCGGRGGASAGAGGGRRDGSAEHVAGSGSTSACGRADGCI